ncbi:MAG: pentapeptide repeat-containing protein [Nitrospinae bacterium]|nr:pentapeptide repeat-containing protein [Nitrospinota bacterium]
MLDEWIAQRIEVETRKTDLQGADLSNYKLIAADLSDGNFSGADFTGAYLIRANLSGADLSGANLTHAVISEANLSGATFSGADLSDAYLCGADLSHAVNLTCDQIELARIDRDTKLPGNIKIAWVSNDAYECEEHAGKNSR